MVEARSGPAILASLLLMASVAWSAPPRIEVEALFTDAAVLMINGERKMLRAGQSYKGVTLVAAYSRTATLEVDGEIMVLGTSRRIGAQYETAESQVVNIPRDAMLQYQTTATFFFPGSYVIGFWSNDGELSSFDQVAINVIDTNTAPVVDAGPDQTITRPDDTADLEGTVTDDGLPDPPGAVEVEWQKLSGPGDVTFGDPTKTNDPCLHYIR